MNPADLAELMVLLRRATAALESFAHGQNRRIELLEESVRLQASARALDGDIASAIKATAPPSKTAQAVIEAAEHVASTTCGDDAELHSRLRIMYGALQAHSEAT